MRPSGNIDDRTRAPEHHPASVVHRRLLDFRDNRTAVRFRQMWEVKCSYTRSTSSDQEAKVPGAACFLRALCVFTFASVGELIEPYGMIALYAHLNSF